MYADFLRDIPLPRGAGRGPARVAELLRALPHNDRMNRIAWLGQASMCYATGIPSTYCNALACSPRRSSTGQLGGLRVPQPVADGPRRGRTTDAQRRRT